MASIIKKKIRGQVYYYAVESKRVDGKPRIVWQKYLGKAGDIVQAVSEAGRPPQPRSARIYSFGAEAALLGIGRRLGLAEIINKHAGGGGGGPGPGEFILLHAINACTGAGAKLSRWFGRTMLRRHFKLTPVMLGEKRFWHEAETISKDVLERIQLELAERILSEFGVGPQALLYQGLQLPEAAGSRGFAAAGPLPEVSLLVSADYKVPLFYEMHGADCCGEEPGQGRLARLAGKYRELVRAGSSPTLVRQLCLRPGESCGADPPFRLLATLAPGENEELLEVPLSRFHHLRESRREKIKVYRSAKKICGQKGVVLLVYSETEMLRQLAGVRAALQEGVRELLELKECLAACALSPGPGDQEERQLADRIDQILSRPYLKSLLQVTVTRGRGGGPDLELAVNSQALAHLKETRLGKTIIFTDHTNWDNDQIYGVYAGRLELAEALGLLKRPGGVWPVSGKEDSRQRVNAFCYILGLTLLTLLRRELHRYGIRGGMPELLKTLSEMREVAVVYTREDLRARKREFVTLAEFDPLQKEIYECLRLSQFEAGADLST